jgi:hypothetical protein
MPRDHNNSLSKFRFPAEKDSQELVDNWQNKWRISPTESLFVAWMSINLNLQKKSSKNAKDTLMDKTNVYYKLDYSSESRNTCIPVLNHTSHRNDNGNNFNLDNVIGYNIFAII